MGLFASEKAHIKMTKLVLILGSLASSRILGLNSRFILLRKNEVGAGL